jgi:hypothetical protein
MLIYRICATLILIVGAILGYREGERNYEGNGIPGVILGLIASGILDFILSAIWLRF